MTARDLKDGIKFQLETKNKEDWRVATVGYHDVPHIGGRFFIYFNGVYIHHSKTFPSLQIRLKKLVNKWDLVRIEYDENSY